MIHNSLDTSLLPARTFTMRPKPLPTPVKKSKDILSPRRARCCSRFLPCGRVLIVNTLPAVTIPFHRRSSCFLFLARSILSSTVLALAFIMLAFASWGREITNGVCDRPSWWSAAMGGCSIVDRAGLHDGVNTLGGGGRCPQGAYSLSLLLCTLVGLLLTGGLKTERGLLRYRGRRGNGELTLEDLEGAIVAFIQARLPARLARSHGKCLPALGRYISPQVDPDQVP